MNRSRRMALLPKASFLKDDDAIVMVEDPTIIIKSKSTNLVSIPHPIGLMIQALMQPFGVGVAESLTSVIRGYWTCAGKKVLYIS
jgi:hypothetical protein